MNHIFYHSPIGILLLSEQDGYLVGLDFSLIPKDSSIESKTPFLENCIKQLDEYFAGLRKEFDIKFKLTGTLFQKSVWNALCTIKYGQTVSYKDIAIKIDNPKAARAVGNANNKNPIGIIIPCHRVIGSNNKMVGYAGGIDKKEFLLALEEKYK